MVCVPPPKDKDDSHYEQCWYVWVLRIYHVKVSCSPQDIAGGNDIHRMEFLWVRWFGTEPGYQHGFQRAKLPKISLSHLLMNRAHHG